MKTLILIAALALASLLPTTASARPILDPVVSTPAPVFVTHHESTLGYLLVGLGGLALGAGGTLSLRRIA
jgi:hypothetical protein